ncbi:MAG: GNAT family N-acetyltransferase [Flavobacteriaceae bacterium]|nr:GNAT family N-acetyltransferase [Bacteroidia bacterium]NNF74386.1 GNAT family N-acetyltransferase [Flavobacteriaceae bacterium]NNK71589.1 GNAT family N-acetyltransferase [Flavobacteriaceae bacterium]
MAIKIRKATYNDMPDVLELIKELAHFEREPDAVEVTVKELQADGFATNPAFFCLVAEKNNQIQGMALMYMRYSTWKGKVLHLEDLIVKNDARGAGIGTRLFDAVVKYGSKLGVKRISWVVLDWNHTAIEFYKKKGARVLDDWAVVQLDERGIKNYIDNLSQ